MLKMKRAHGVLARKTKGNGSGENNDLMRLAGGGGGGVGHREGPHL